MNEFVVQKKSKYTFSDIGKAALYLLTKTDQSIKMSKYKRNFRYVYYLTYICWVFMGFFVPILIQNSAPIDFSILIYEIVLNIVAFINMSVIGFLKSRYM